MLQRFRPTALLALAALAAPPAAAEPRLSADVVPVFEAVRLKLDPAQEGYTGSVRVELDVKKPTANFSFHSRGQELEHVRLTKGGAELTVRHEALGEDVSVKPERLLSPGRYVLEADFSAAYGRQATGLYRADQGGAPYLFTQFEPDDARAAFPCWDEPGFKQPWQVTLEVPEGQLAVSNTPVESEQAGAGWKTIVFERTAPLPSYLVAVAVGPFEAVEIPGLGVPGRVLALKGQAAQATLAAEYSPQLLKALETWFERPYPYKKLDLVAVPEFWPTGMENAGAITFKSEVLLLDPRTASARDRALLIRVLAHEFAHQWFGDLVTMAWWDDLWLNESFADWMGDKIAGQAYPQYPFALDQLRDAQRIMREDGRLNTRPIRRRVEDASGSLQGVGLAYNKGKAVLGMFEGWMGAETFRQGVNAHLRAHEWKTAVSADLWAALGRAAGKDVPTALATFIEQPGFPLVRVEPLAGGRLRLTQQRFANHGVAAPPLRWSIPLVLAYSDGGPRRTRSLLLTQTSEIVQLDVRQLDWVMPNGHGQGYYRFGLPAELLARLSGPAARSLDTRERVALVSNAEALLDAGLLPGDRYLATLAAFAGDEQPAVLNAVLEGLEPARRAFVGAERQADFARYLRRSLGPSLDRIGLERREGEPEDVALLRPELLLLLGREGRDERVLAQARAWTASYGQDPAAVDPALAEVALELAAVAGDRALYEDFRKRFEGASGEERRRYLGALGCFPQPELQEAALGYVLDANLRPDELFQVPRCMVQNEAGSERAFDWLRRSFARLAPRLPPFVLGYLPRLAGGCSPERVQEARAFFAVPEHGGAVALRGVEAVAEQVKDCAELRAREGAAVGRYLAAP